MKSVTCSRWVSIFKLGIALVLLAQVGIHAVAAQTEKVLYSFLSETDPNEPVSGLVQDATGALYGTTCYSSSVFKMAPPTKAGGPWTETEIYNFSAFNDGVCPSDAGHLVFDSKGSLYGTTTYGGYNGEGTVFELSRPSSGDTWNETLLYFFEVNVDDAQNPAAAVIWARGSLYGTTTFGGQWGQGAVFRLTPGEDGGAWQETVLYSFTGGSDGGAPSSGLTAGPGGVLYGVTWLGGLYPYNGVVYQLTPPAGGSGEWKEKVLHNFGGSDYDGGNPAGAPTLDKEVNLYGTTECGYTHPYGMVYKLTPPSWKETILYYFTGGADGGGPVSQLIFDDQGALYGTTTGSGCVPTSNGSVFKLTPPSSSGDAWTETTLYSFTGGKDGGTPYDGLLLSDGVLYGTTSLGGAHDYGTVFSLKP